MIGLAMLKVSSVIELLIIFFFNDTATTEIYTLSLHDALPISICSFSSSVRLTAWTAISTTPVGSSIAGRRDRKSTRLNSSHSQISYAVFCLKKKNNHEADHNCPSRAAVDNIT